jgi:beta-glucuronidase
MAVTHADREWLVNEAQALGANLMRTHYPPGADLVELADRKGMLLWSEVPVYGIKPTYLKRESVRRRALREVEANITANGNHPSIVIWSIANELSSTVGPTQADYIRRAARLAHTLDPTRPVAIAIQGYPSKLCQPPYRVLDIVGVNDYFGWYTGPNGDLADPDGLTAYLDGLRACYPRQALMVTEFGAEANRDGPPEEKGTWGFQQEFADQHLSVFATKSWLSGMSYWALNEFRVRPAWEGGNPRPQSPVHQKGLLTYQTRERKPAWDAVHRWYTGQAPGVPAPSRPVD